MKAAILASLLFCGCASQINRPAPSDTLMPTSTANHQLPFKGRDGIAEAKQDIATGRPKLKIYGLPSPSDGELAQMLMQRFGVQFEPIAGCIVDQYLVAYAEAYNRVVTQHVEAIHGAGAIAKAEKHLYSQVESK